MLYDNAQLLGVYARWWRQSGDPLGERVARETADFLLAELRTEQGGFASALDADTEGVEGRFYAWTPAQLVEVLGDRGRPRGPRTLLEVTDGRHLRARRVHAAAARRPRRPGAVGRGAGRGCWPPGRRGSARPATTRWSPPGTGWRSPSLRRGRHAARRAAVRRRGRSTPARLLGDLHLDGGRLRRVSPRRRRRPARRGARGLRLRRGRLPRAALGHRGRGLARGGRRAARHGAGRVRGRRRRLLRHRRRRRAAGDPAPRPLRQRQPVGPVGAGARAAGLRRRDRLGPAPRRGRGGAAQRPHPRRAGAAVRRAGRWPPPRPPWPDRSRWRSWARPGTRPAAALERVAREATSPGLRSWSGSPTPGRTRRASRCSPVAGWSRGGPAAYVCRGMVCDRPVTTPAELRALLRR